MCVSRTHQLLAADDAAHDMAGSGEHRCDGITWFPASGVEFSLPGSLPKERRGLTPRGSSAVADGGR